MVLSCLRMGAAAVVLALPGSAQDATGGIALGGGGGGLLDVDGLQNSLKSGGVEGLNKMLQAMAAAGGAGDGPSPHLTKDASGNAMYDFRDISGAPKSVPPAQAAAAPPAVQKAVRKATAPLAQQAPMQSRLTASSRPQDELPMPDFGIIEPAKAQKPRAGAQSLFAAKVTAEAQAMPPNKDHEDEETTPEPGVQESHLIVWPPEPPAVAAPQVKVAKVAVARVPPAAPDAQVQHSTNLDEATAAALADGLESMRHNLDTLLGEADTMLHTHQQTGTPTPTAAPASASIGAAGGAAGAEILKRLQEIEDENAQMRSTEEAQALRLEAVEAKEQKENAELKTLEKENVQLHDQIKASESTAFLQDNKSPHNSQTRWGIRTFFHKKEKTLRH